MTRSRAIPDCVGETVASRATELKSNCHGHARPPRTAHAGPTPRPRRPRAARLAIEATCCVAGRAGRMIAVAFSRRSRRGPRTWPPPVPQSRGVSGGVVAIQCRAKRGETPVAAPSVEHVPAQARGGALSDDVPALDRRKLDSPAAAFVPPPARVDTGLLVAAPPTDVGEAVEVHSRKDARSRTSRGSRSSGAPVRVGPGGLFGAA